MIPALPEDHLDTMVAALPPTEHDDDERQLRRATAAVVLLRSLGARDRSRPSSPPRQSSRTTPSCSACAAPPVPVSRRRSPRACSGVPPRFRTRSCARSTPSAGGRTNGHDDRTPCKAARPPEERGARRRSFQGASLRRLHPRKHSLPRPSHGERPLPHARRRQHRPAHRGWPSPTPGRPHHSWLLDPGEPRIPPLLCGTPDQRADLAGSNGTRPHGSAAKAPATRELSDVARY
jgi:hypothetical protein